MTRMGFLGLASVCLWMGMGFCGGPDVGEATKARPDVEHVHGVRRLLGVVVGLVTWK